MKHRNSLLLLFLFAVSAVSAQSRVTADVRSVSVNAGQKVTVEKRLFLRNTGRLVIEQTRPEHLIYVTNSLGEMKIYNPEKNQVMIVSDAEASSGKELLSMFMNNGYVDMGLPLYGYKQTKVQEVDGQTVKTFTPTADNKGVAKIELVFERQLPVCMVYYGHKGKAIRKVFFSRYISDRMVMPTRITEIEYTSPRDSIVRLSTYSNFLYDNDAISPMFDYKIPDKATPVSYKATAR